MRLTAGFLGISVLLIAVTGAQAEDWPRWRGPDANGISRETQWKKDFGRTAPTMLWKASVGIGFSSVVVANGRLITNGHVDGSDIITCLDARTGAKHWSHAYEAPLGDKFFEGGPTSTPTLDGDVVYILSRQGDVFCLAVENGAVRWQKNIAEETGYRVPGWGFGGSPFVHGDRLILNVGGGGVALNKTDGKLIWQSNPQEPGYSTPLLYTTGNQTGLALASSKTIIGVNPIDGTTLWSHRWITRYGVNAADPILVGDRVFVTSGYGKGAALLQLGDATPTEIWRNKNMRSQFNSCVLIDKYLYGVDGDTGTEAVLRCIAFDTGEILWSREGFGSGALMAADGHLIALAENGTLLIGAAAPGGFTPLTDTRVIEGKCWTVPVLAHGLLYVRTADGDLRCLDLRSNPAP